MISYFILITSNKQNYNFNFIFTTMMREKFRLAAIIIFHGKEAVFNLIKETEIRK